MTRADKFEEIFGYRPATDQVLCNEHDYCGESDACNYCMCNRNNVGREEDWWNAEYKEPRKGHWISHREHCEMNNLRPSGLGSYFWCSECDCGIDVMEWHRNNYNYCPNCGCRMVKENEE